MSRVKSQQQYSSGTPSALGLNFPAPIIAKRDPTTLDTGFLLGQLWINKTSGNVFCLAEVAAAVATWTSLGGATGSFTTVAAATIETSTAATQITLASGNVFTGVGSNAAVGFTFTPKGTGGLTLTTGNLTATNGNVVLGTAGNTISIKSGTNARIGQATLVAGAATVANTSVTANTRVFISRTALHSSPALGHLIAVPTAGVGFVITSYDATASAASTDVSTVDWVLIESA